MSLFKNQRRAHAMFEVLLREHHRLLLAYARSLVTDEQVAEDLVQDSFVIAWEKFANFDTGRDFGSWMRGIIRYEYLHWARKKKEVVLEDAQLELLDARYASLYSANCSQEEIFQAVGNCTKSLPEHLGRIIHSIYHIGLTGPELATQEGISEPNLRKRLQRARDQIAQCLETRFQISPNPPKV